LKCIQSKCVDFETARRILKERMYYDILDGLQLISIASITPMTRRVRVVMDVYTRPGYRGRGYANVISAATSLALEAGVTPLLHVDETNIPAIRVYETLGYRVVNWRPLLSVE